MLSQSRISTVYRVQIYYRLDEDVVHSFCEGDLEWVGGCRHHRQIVSMLMKHFCYCGNRYGTLCSKVTMYNVSKKKQLTPQDNAQHQSYGVDLAHCLEPGCLFYLLISSGKKIKNIAVRARVVSCSDHLAEDLRRETTAALSTPVTGCLLNNLNSEPLDRCVCCKTD